MHRIDELMLLKYPYYPKRFSIIIFRKIPMKFSTEMKKNPRICLEPQKIPNF